MYSNPAPHQKACPHRKDSHRNQHKNTLRDSNKTVGDCPPLPEGFVRVPKPSPRQFTPPTPWRARFSGRAPQPRASHPQNPPPAPHPRTPKNSQKIFQRAKPKVSENPNQTNLLYRDNTDVLFCNTQKRWADLNASVRLTSRSARDVRKTP